MKHADGEKGDVQDVQGERSVALVNAKRSLQSRTSSLLAATLMIALGLCVLTWYYANAFTRKSHAQTAGQSTAATRAQGEMSLPPLGHIVPPPVVMASAPSAAKDTISLQEVPLPETGATTTQTPVSNLPVIASDGGQSRVATKTPAQLARERRLSGGVFAREPTTASPTVQAASLVDSTLSGGADTTVSQRRTSETHEAALQAYLVSSPTAPVPAQLLPSGRFLLPKGAFIDCTLETAIDSTLPGMTTCVTAADTFSADGKVVLLERGSKLVGETRGGVQQGQARVFVVWSQARTPSGVIVPLDSPGTDELGRSGLPGEVERHFWQRFGAAMLISIINGVVQAGVVAANHSGGAVLYAPSTSQDMVTEVLKDTVRIPPTISKRNGDRIQVLVARDLDFRMVYELRTPADGR